MRSTRDVPSVITQYTTYGESPVVDGGTITETVYKGEATLTVPGPSYLTLVRLFAGHQPARLINTDTWSPDILSHHDDVRHLAYHHSDRDKDQDAERAASDSSAELGHSLRTRRRRREGVQRLTSDARSVHHPLYVLARVRLRNCGRDRRPASLR